MGGTREGGKQAERTNKRRHGKDFYKRIGQLGGARKVPKGFAIDPKLASRAGKKGGKVSRRRWTPAEREAARERFRRVREGASR